MAKQEDPAANVEAPPAPTGDGVVGLSEGAAVALGAALSRIISTSGPATGRDAADPSLKKAKSARRKRQRSAGGDDADARKATRPRRRPVVLADDADVVAGLVGEREEKVRLKQAKRAKLLFEANARVVPDAATSAVLERALQATATRGAVALFNAVAKAQKAAEQRADGQKKGPPVSRDNFMKMMQEGVAQSSALPMRNSAKTNGDADDADDDGLGPVKGSTTAKWLKDDFLTSRAKKVKDWDQDEPEGGESSSDDDDEEVAASDADGKDSDAMEEEQEQENSESQEEDADRET